MPTNPIYDALALITCIAYEDDDVLLDTLKSFDTVDVVPAFICSIGILEGVVKMLLDTLDAGGLDTPTYEELLQLVATEFASLDNVE